jgi:hypothetical protein
VAQLTRTAFAGYFESQNAAIYSGKLKAQPINLVALGINNGWYDAIIQEREFISFSVNNTYFPLINETIADEYMADYKATCLPALEKCTVIEGDVPDCSAGRNACNVVDIKYGSYYPDVDFYDIRQPESAPFPPSTYISYLQDPAIMKAIGAKVVYSECSDAVDLLFGVNGDSKISPSLARYFLTPNSCSILPSHSFQPGPIRNHHRHLGR